MGKLDFEAMLLTARQVDKMLYDFQEASESVLLNAQRDKCLLAVLEWLETYEGDQLGLSLSDQMREAGILPQRHHQSRSRNVEGDYRRARGVVPQKEGDPLPEEVIRELRGG